MKIKKLADAAVVAALLMANVPGLLEQELEMPATPPAVVEPAGEEAEEPQD